jgi:peptidoglycan/LPS O-acetylase OafA/YrhL
MKFRGFITELDGLRCIAVLLVFMHHFWPQRYLNNPGGALARLGWIGVDLFFVLSGFLITGILYDSRQKSPYFKPFYIRRTLRIFPLYYCALSLQVLFMVLYKGGVLWQRMVTEWGGPWWFYAYIGNIKAALQSAWPPVDFFVPLWSLQVEEQFYLIFPLLVFFLDARVLKRVLWIVIVCSPLLRVLLWVLFPENRQLNYVLLPCRLDGLAWGAQIALYLRTQPAPTIPRHFWAVLTLALVSIALAILVIGGYGWGTPLNRTLGYATSSIAFAAVLVWTLTEQARPATAWLRSRPVLYIGKISYGMYLLQEPGSVVAAGLLHLTHISLRPDGVALSLLRLACTVALASVSFYGMERPLLRLKDRLAPPEPRNSHSR